MDASNNNQPDTNVEVCIDGQPFGTLNLGTGVLGLFDANYDRVLSLGAEEMLELAKVVRDNEKRLRRIAKAAEAGRRWDEAHRIVRDLIAHGVRVRRLDDEYVHGRDTNVIEILVGDTQDVHDHAAGAEVTEHRRESPGYVVTEIACEVVPGVVLTHTEYTNTNEQVPA